MLEREMRRSLEASKSTTLFRMWGMQGWLRSPLCFCQYSLPVEINIQTNSIVCQLLDHSVHALFPLDIGVDAYRSLLDLFAHLWTIRKPVHGSFPPLQITRPIQLVVELVAQLDRCWRSYWTIRWWRDTRLERDGSSSWWWTVQAQYGDINRNRTNAEHDHHCECPVCHHMLSGSSSQSGGTGIHYDYFGTSWTSHH